MPLRLTPLERLVTTSVGGLMRQRQMVARHGKVRYGLKPEEMVILNHVRLSRPQGTVITATSLAEELFIDRKTVERSLKKLVRLGHIIVKVKIGKEVVYGDREDAVYPPFVIDAVIEMVADQLTLGERLKPLVAALDDQDLKARIKAAMNVDKMTAFCLTAPICIGNWVPLCCVVLPDL